MSITSFAGTYQLSPMQEGMLFHHLYAPQSGVFVQQIVGRLHAPLDVTAFRKSWQRVMDRHPILRTSFRWEGLDEPVQDAHPYALLPVLEQDWRGLSERECEYRLEIYLQNDRRQGFVLGDAPLMRLGLFRRSEADWQFVWTAHHALLDPCSSLLVLREVFAFYTGHGAGDEPELEPSRPFTDYAEWLRALEPGAAESFWREELRGFRAPTSLVVAREGTEMLQSEESFAEQDVRLDADVADALRRVASEHQIALGTIVRGAWALLLARYSGDTDVVFGDVRTCGRGAVEGGESMVGLFQNTLPFRARVAPESSALPWLRELDGRQRAARAHEHAPLARVQEWSELARGTALFESVVLIEEAFSERALREIAGSAWGSDDFRLLRQTNYPLSLFAYVESAIRLSLSYDRRRFDDATIARMLGHLQSLLAGIAADPDAPLAELPLLTRAERRQLLEEWNDTRTDVRRDVCLHEMVAAQAARAPERTALLVEGVEISYAELNARANRLAHRLRKLGVGPETRVGLCVERDGDMVVGVLGILKAGGAYVPVDPAYPAERIAFVLEDAKVAALVTQGRVLAALPALDVPMVRIDEDATLESESTENPVSGAGPAHLAYVIYTSGSTGRPKGVQVTHANVAHYVQAIRVPLGIVADDRYLHTASIAFSSSVRQLAVPLSIGATVVIASRAAIGDPRELFALVKSAGVTVVDLVPSYWSHCIQTLETTDVATRTSLLDNRLRLVLSASEPLLAEVPRRWTSRLRHPARLINMFGQTETTGIVTVFPIPDTYDDDAAIVGIGRPLANTRTYIVDAQMQPVPIGVPGELCIGGEGLARGYLNRPELTAEKFIADPFTPDAGARIYRTGDRARYLPDGTIEFLGRGDNQVKIRGHRVEVEEVEGALRRHAAVRAAVVTVRADASGERRLVAYVVCAHPAPTVEALRAALKRQLPDYMIPSAFVQLEQLPRTPNGKVDRGALPAPDWSRPELGNGYVEPRSALERAIARAWSDVLGVDRIGAEDNFFALGGHSLMVVRVVSRLRETLGVDVPLRRIFERPTVAELALSLGGIATDARLGPAPIPRLARESDIPLSFAQQRLWLLNQIEPDSAAYNLVAAMRLEGTLDVGALERTLTEIVRRHESLRTVFPSTTDGTARQVILPPFAVALPVDDARPLAGDPAHARQQLAAAEARRPFDLAHGPLFRARLLRTGDAEHLLVLTMHHIVSDGWSRGVLYREVGLLYDAFVAGRPSPLPEPVIQYADYAAWQRASLRDDVLASQQNYWTTQLRTPLPRLDLPTDRPRPAMQSFAGATHSFVLPAALAEEVKALGAREEATLFMTLLAAFHTLLHRYSGQDDIVVGAPVAGRSRVETEALIGFFVNTLAMRADLSGDPTFRELLARVRETALGGYAHQDIPFDRLVDAVHPERDLSRSPIFQVLFILQNVPVEPMNLGGLAIEQLDVDLGAAKFDLTLSLVAGTGGLTGHLEYNTDLYDAATIERLAGHFRAMLEGIVSDPEQKLSRLPLLTGEERKRMLVDWNATTVAPAGERTIHRQFEAQVARTPDAIALVFRNSAITYRDLDARANQVAHYLRGLGVGADTLVGVFMERSIDLMVGLLGILKAGGAYVPLDPAYPRDRLAFMLTDAKAPVLLTQQRLAGRLPRHAARVVSIDSDWDVIARASAASPAGGATGDNLAYVIYTSGSTGKPKGVMVGHGNVTNFFAGMDERVGAGAPGVWLAVTSISFDISVLELFWTVARGYQVVIHGDEERQRAALAFTPKAADKRIGFSLFYFASNEQAGSVDDKYRLLIEGAKFADRNGFEAVWTPERHFHAFGGLYPNPSVTNAALAVITERVQLRSGSVVLPLHSPLRVAEEWSVVDNISRGRVGLAFASGWHDRDFVFAPQNYANRRELMYEMIEQLRSLWRGGSMTLPGGTGTPHTVTVLPRPIQPELPIWITAAGTAETFVKAGRIGANLLTHLLGQSIDQVADKIRIYREARRDAGHEGPGHVTLMMHTFVGTDAAEVRETVRVPFKNYLRTSVDLIKGLATERGQDIRSAEFTSDDMEALLDHAFHRYVETSALIGTPERCLEMVDNLKAIGVDEIACLIDFGVDNERTLDALANLAEVRQRSEPVASEAEYMLPALLARHEVTHFQCTPSMASMLLAGDDTRAALRGVHTLMVGGEALPSSLVADLRTVVSGEIVNMYGPTETTIWSSTYAVNGDAGTIPIGTPIANTELYILDRNRQPVPVGVAGELYIGGAGVVRGYLDRPELTAERFVAHPFHTEPGARLYRTGDLARWRSDGVVEFLGRVDHQVKIRGHRIELGEIETLLAAHPAVREAVVIAREDVAGDKRLVGYVTLDPAVPATPAQLRDMLRLQLPEYMVPSHVVVLDELPRTPNLKVDRKALPTPDAVEAQSDATIFVAAENDLERTIAGIWQDVLKAPRVGVHDNFFDLGGHSLLTVKVHARLRQAVDRPVSITDLFRFPTIRALASHLGGAAPAGPSAVEQSADRAEARRQAMLRRRPRR